jgi:AraC-like DNA-binding protein
MGVLVLPVASRALLEACGRLGLDAETLRARAGLADVALDDPDVRVDSDAADALWREAFAASRDPFLALHAAERTPFGAYRVLDYLAATGATVGEGVRRAAAYFPLLDPRGLLEVREAGARVELTFRSAIGGELPAPAQEYTLAMFLSRVRHVAGGAVRLAALRFTFPRPPGAAEHARSFGVEPEYEADLAALVLARETWDLRLPSADPALFATLDAHAKRALTGATGAGELAGRVRAAIAAALEGTAPSVGDVARRLGLSERTLQRRLEAADTSYAQLLDEVRRERALAFLGVPDVSIAEVSWLLGFSEQSAFTRAFRRWTGKAPSAWRRAGRDR